jgi:hypothetical protein
VLLVQWESDSSKTPPRNAIQEGEFSREMVSDRTPVTSKFSYRVQILGILIASQETCEGLSTHSSKLTPRVDFGKYKMLGLAN